LVAVVEKGKEEEVEARWCAIVFSSSRWKKLEGKKAVFRPGGTASPLYVSFVSSPLEMVRVWIARNTHGEIERGSDERIGGRREEEAFFLVSIDGRLLFDFFDAKKSARVLGSSDKTGRASSGSSKSKRHTGASPREREQKKKRR